MCTGTRRTGLRSSHTGRQNQFIKFRTVCQLIGKILPMPTRRPNTHIHTRERIAKEIYFACKQAAFNLDLYFNRQILLYIHCTTVIPCIVSHGGSVVLVVGANIRNVNVSQLSHWAPWPTSDNPSQITVSLPRMVPGN